MAAMKPAMGQPAQRDWTVGAFSCFDDMGLCCDVFWCSCCMQGRIYSAAEENRADNMNVPVCLFMCCCGAWPCEAAFAFVERSKVQERYNVKKDMACDLLLSLFCSPCVLCQVHTELAAAGNSPGHTCCAPSRVFSHPQNTAPFYPPAYQPQPAGQQHPACEPQPYFAQPNPACPPSASAPPKMA